MRRVWKSDVPFWTPLSTLLRVKDTRMYMVLAFQGCNCILNICNPNPKIAGFITVSLLGVFTFLLIGVLTQMISFYVYLSVLFFRQGVSTSMCSGILSEIQKSIRQKDEEMSWVDACCLQIAIKSSKGSRGAESCTFQTRDPNIKKEWIVGMFFRKYLN